MRAQIDRKKIDIFCVNQPIRHQPNHRQIQGKKGLDLVNKKTVVSSTRGLFLAFGFLVLVDGDLIMKKQIPRQAAAVALMQEVFDNQPMPAKKKKRRIKKQPIKTSTEMAEKMEGGVGNEGAI